ncbi:MAG: tetratricopeptide repeat protein [Pseudomonadales bacterium]
MKYLAIFLLAFSANLFAQSSFELAEDARLKQDWEVAISEYEKAFEKGNPIAAHWLGTFYLDGIGVTQNSVHAAVYFYFAANEGVQGSMVYLANMHISGNGVIQDCAKATSWVNKFSSGVISESWQKKLAQCHATFNK